MFLVLREVLGVSDSARADRIRRAWREMRAAEREVREKQPKDEKPKATAGAGRDLGDED